jgi:hypothetical protein
MGIMTKDGWREDLPDTPQTQKEFGVGGGSWNGTQTVGQTGGSGKPSSPAAPNNNAGAQQLGSQINSLMGAIAAGNKEAFDEAVRQFNVTFGLDREKFAEGIRQFNVGLGISEAGLTGYYKPYTPAAQESFARPADGTFVRQPGPVGPGTQIGQMQGGKLVMFPNWEAYKAAGGPEDTSKLQAASDPNTFLALQTAPAQGTYGAPVRTLQAQNQDFTQGMNVVTTAAQLQANPFRQQQALGQMSRLIGGESVAGFGAVGNQAQSTQNSTGASGGLGYLQQMIDDIRDPTANTQNVKDVLGAIPTPNKVNSVDFFRSPQSTQNMLLQGIQEKYGIDPNDALGQIRNTLPAFQSPATFGQVKR